MARRIVLTSPLAPDAIARKMRKVLGGRTAKPARGVTGNGSEQTMTLFYFRPNIRNSFQTTLVATMEPADGGTRIEGKIGPPAGVFVFLGCWFGFLIVFLAMVVGGMAASGAPTEAIVPFVAIPLAMMGFGAMLYRLGTWNAKKDKAAILEFLATTVEARP
ncbi:MAG: hypothetical protein V4610_19350 [Pseudomonadota bacterium]|jgi:hypothetical protein|uniref:Uncharacterized protein n=1 Tax=hydrothermal vent metagenome TaxID=652676 RepID=A0A160TRG1_9ZZZZ